MKRMETQHERKRGAFFFSLIHRSLFFLLGKRIAIFGDRARTTLGHRYEMARRREL